MYPQPPLSTPSTLHSYSDPTTLTINGVCVGVTSTDVLFHLSARTMFRGWVWSLHCVGVVSTLCGCGLYTVYRKLLPCFACDQLHATNLFLARINIVFDKCSQKQSISYSGNFRWVLFSLRRAPKQNLDRMTYSGHTKK